MRCSMPDCGTQLIERWVPGTPSLGAKAVTVYRCPLCDTRRCKCRHVTQDPKQMQCRSCGRSLRVDRSS